MNITSNSVHMLSSYIVLTSSIACTVAQMDLILADEYLLPSGLNNLV